MAASVISAAGEAAAWEKPEGVWRWWWWWVSKAGR